MRLRLLAVMLFLGLAPVAEAQDCGLYFRIFNEGSRFGRVMNRATTAVVSRTPSVKKINEAYVAAREDKSARDFFSKFLEQLGISVKVTGRGLEAIPAKGPLVAVANHPFGFADGASMMSMIHQVRPDVKVLMFDIMAVEGLENQVIPIKLLGSKEARKAANAKALQAAEEWLREGHALVIFPAGEVTAYQKGTRIVAENAWRPGAARLAQRTGAQVLPVYIPGQNSRMFLELRKLNDLFGTARLPAEVVRMNGQSVVLKVGDPIPADRIRVHENEAIKFLQRQHELLKADAPSATR